MIVIPPSHLVLKHPAPSPLLTCSFLYSSPPFVSPVTPRLLKITCSPSLCTEVPCIAPLRQDRHIDVTGTTWAIEPLGCTIVRGLTAVVHVLRAGALADLIDIVIEEGAALFVCAVGVPPVWVVEKL